MLVLHGAGSITSHIKSITMPTSWIDDMDETIQSQAQEITALKEQIVTLERLNRTQASTIEHLQGEVNKANDYMRNRSNNSFQMGD